MSRSSSAFTGKPFGVTRVCRFWDVARSTVYWRRQPSRPEPTRRGPRGFHTDVELTGEIKSVLTESLFTGEGCRKVWAILRDKDIRSSKERTLRLMRENDVLKGSPSYVRGAQDKRIVERFMRTLKENRSACRAFRPSRICAKPPAFEET